MENLPKTDNFHGMGLGIKDAAVVSDGYKTDKIHKPLLDDKIAKYNKKLAIRTKNYKINTKNSSKTKTKLSGLYGKKKNQIIDQIHKFTTKIVRKFDEIFVGDLS
ncbi:MAG: transposase [Methanobrevibacter sp.]|nr:transposase [Candidatus Methanovirga basalitermitum]